MIILTAAITVGVVILGTMLMTPVYKAVTTLRIATASSGTTDYANYMYADRLMNTYVNIATSGPVKEQLAKDLGLNPVPVIQAETLPNTELIKITVEDPNPETTASVANTLAEILIAQSKQFYGGGGKSPVEIIGEQLVQAQSELDKAQAEYEILITQDPTNTLKINTASQALELKRRTYSILLDQYEQSRIREAMRANMVSVVEPATIPQNPYKPRPLMNIALGLLVGLLGGLGLAFLFESMDSTLTSTKSIEAATDLEIIAKIPEFEGKQLDISLNGSAPQEEAFRYLRTHILLQERQKPLKSLLITGAEPKQGKSTIVANLALSLAKSGKKVIVIDADMRLPKLHKLLLFQLSNKKGLRDILEQEASLEEVVKKGPIDNLAVITSGSRPEDPINLLGSAQMATLIANLSQQFDYVLLDAPAMLQVADVAMLVQNVDGIILVVRRLHSHREAVEAASKYLAGLQDKTLGVIVNQAEQSSSYYQNATKPNRRKPLKTPYLRKPPKKSEQRKPPGKTDQPTAD